MRITFDPTKRARTLLERDLDFMEAAEVFADETIDIPDTRRDYGETRIMSVGYLRGRVAILIWTQRGDAQHIISMRKANDREEARYADRLAKEI